MDPKFLPLGGSGAVGECYISSEPCLAGQWSDRVTTYLMVLLIMVFALCWEGLLKLVTWFVPSQLRPVVNRVLMEFAELGLMSLLIYIPSKSSWFVNLSNSIWNDCNHLLHLIHSTHFLVLWATLSFLGFVLLLMLSSIYWLRRWAAFEDKAQGEPDLAEVRRLVQRSGPRRWLAALWFGASTATEYRVLRECFILDVNSDEQRDAWGINFLHFDFPFDEYLKLQQANFYIRVVNIMASSWISLVLSMGVGYGLMQLSQEAVVIVSVCLQAALFLATMALQLWTVVLYEHTAPQLDPDAVELLTPDSVPGQWGESVPRPAASDSLDLRLKTLRLWGDHVVPPSLEDGPGTSRRRPSELSVRRGPDPEAQTPEGNDPLALLRAVSFKGSRDSPPAPSPRATPRVSPMRHAAGTGGLRSQSVGSLAPEEAALSSGNVSEAASDLPPAMNFATTRRSTRLLHPSLALSATREVLTSFLPTVQSKQTPKGIDTWMRLAIQLILFYSGLNMSFFIDIGSRHLLARCGLGGDAVSLFVFAMYLSMLLGIALSLLQTVRIHVMQTCLGEFKNYATISQVLRSVRLRALFPEKEREVFARGSLRTVRRAAKQLFRQLGPPQLGQESASVLALRRFLLSQAEGVTSEEDVNSVLLEMDQNGSGRVEFRDFLLGLKRIFDR
eukprot:EG_transcript_2135